MSTIDRRVVEAQFDNKQFHTGVKQTMDDLSSLQKGLQLQGATNGLQEVQRASERMGFEGLSQSIDNVANKFNALRVAGVAALSAIVVKVTNAATQMARSLTIAPVSEGLQEYETNLNSIQTILSNTKWENKTLDDVNTALQELNEYSDLTIYNFAEMARNIGTFTAAGVELDTSVGAIKGIANLAATSGSNSQQASVAMYQLSQALSTGTVKLMDWNSVVNAGLGGKVFQDAIKETARVHGIAIDDIIEENGSFRDSLQDGWFTADILTETLNRFTGDLSEAQLEQMGYSQEQIEQSMEMAETAVDAATKVKTFNQLIGTLQEVAGSGWAQTWQLVFGDFEEAKELFTGMNDVIGGWIDTVSEARNQILMDWKELGGRTALIEGVSNAFKSVMSVVEPIRDAFKDIFPTITGERLYEITVNLRDFFETFKLGEKDAENLKRTFRGVFALFGTGFEVIKQTTSFLVRLFTEITKGSGDILEFTAGIGDMIVNFYEAVKNGDDLTEFFDRLFDKSLVVINGIRNFADETKKFLEPLKERLEPIEDILDRIGNAFENFISRFEPSTDALDPILERLKQAGEFGEDAESFWDGFFDKISRATEYFSGLADTFAENFSMVGQWISDALSNLDINFDDVLATINTGLFAVLVNTIRNAFGGDDDDDMPGFLDGIKGVIGELTGTLEQMQNVLRATTLLQIATALGILAASAVALSTLDAGALARALGAMAAMFVQLFTALGAMQAIGGVRGLSLTATGLILIAGAMRVMAEVVEELAELTWDEITRGLAAMAGIIAGFVGATKGMAGHAGGMISAGASMIFLATGIKILGTVLRDLSDMSWDEIGRGLAGVAGLLTSLGLFTRFSNVNAAGIASGAGILLIAGAIKLMVTAVEDFAELNWQEIGRGLGSITGILAAFGGFTRLVDPRGLIRTGISLGIVAGAMMVMGEAMKVLSQFSWGEIGRGLATMAGSLLLVSAALTVIPPTSLASAAAIAAVGGALILIADFVERTGDLGWGQIAKGMVTLGGALTLIALTLIFMSGTLAGSAALAVAAGALSLLTPVLTTLGDMSIGEIAKALGTLAGVFTVLGLAGIYLTPVVPTLLGVGAAIALIGTGIGLAGAGILAFSAGLTAIAAAGAGAAVAITAILSAIIGLIPAFARQLANGINVFLQIIETIVPQISRTATAIVIAFLEQLENGIPQLTDTFTTMITAMLETMRDLAPDFIDTMFQMLNDLASAAEEYTPEITEKIVNIVVGMINALEAGVPDFVEAASQLIATFLESFADNTDTVITAGADLIISLIEGIAENYLRIQNAAAETIIEFLNGIAASIDANAEDFRTAGVNIATAIVDGFTGGLGSKVREAANAAADMARGALESAKNVLGIESPSKEFKQIGKFVGDGFAEGLIGSRSTILNTWWGTQDLIREALNSSRRDIEKYKSELERLRDAETRDNEKIKEKTAALEQAIFERNRLKDSLAAMKGELTDERKALVQLGREWDNNNEKMQTAKRELDDIRREFEGFRDSTTDRYSELPGINEGEKALQRYMSELKETNTDLSKFNKTLFKLRKAGVADSIYRDLVEKGPEALDFATQLLSGGPDAINEVNKYSELIEKGAKRLGQQSSNALYRSGIQAADGIVKGLRAKEDDIEEQMRRIGKKIQKALKLELQIKSPSRVMQSLGEFTSEGIAVGMENAVPLIDKAAKNVGDSAIESMRKSISSLSDEAIFNDDFNPRITPIIDLTEIQKGASAMKSQLEKASMDVSPAVLRARALSSEYESRTGDVDIPEQVGSTTQFSYTQNNYSPKALSEGEIYRQTKNQLARTKGGL